MEKFSSSSGRQDEEVLMALMNEESLTVGTQPILQKRKNMGHLFQKFKVILWKSYILRKRHWLLSLFEVVAPLLLYYLFAKYNVIQVAKHQLKVYEIQNLDDIVDVYASGRSDIEIGFAPDSLTDYKLVQNVTFDLEKRLNETSLQDIYQLSLFKTETNLENWFYSKKDYEFNPFTVVGVVCCGGNSQTKLTYEIRLPGNLAPPASELYGWEFLSGRYFYTPFMIIQMVMDLNFIQRITGRDENSSIALQKFPDQESNLSNNNSVAFLLITTFSFVFLMPAILKTIVEEKLTGIKELQKMMGLHSWLLWAGWMVHSLIIYAVSIILITIMLKITWGINPAPLYQVDGWLIIWFLLFLFIIATVLYCFAVSVFFSSPNIGMIIAILLWIIPPFYCIAMFMGPVSKTANLISCLSPPLCLSWAFSIFLNFQQQGKIWSWSMFFKKGTNGGLSMADIVVMFCIEWILFGAITWYMDSIKPGPFGRAKPFYFIFQCWKKDTEIVGSNEDDDQKHFEAPPSGTKIGISIQNLRKVFGQNVAVDKVSLDIYEGEITALLGHNGAGKTTTMSILSGLFSPSKGAVIVDGQNIFNNMDEFRNNLGLCPQHNLLFSYLTVMEHLIFFGMLKGMTWKQAEAMGLNLLQTFHIADKSNQFVAKLSGGMKRKVCLSISLMADPKIIMLDEPTAGMDPESRRSVWDILLSYRGARTILITTHFMEEADVLGDRIAIMDHGRVSCYGTSIFLKKLYGTGYHIVISKDQRKSESAITSVMESHLSDSKLKCNMPSQLIYNVSSNDAPVFSTLFGALESRKEELGITGISVACTTMEDVFLKVAEGGLSVDVKDNTAEVPLNSTPTVTTKERVEGFPLAKLQLRALFLKKMIFLYRTWLTTLIFGLVPLVAIILLLAGGSLFGSKEENQRTKLSLELYKNIEVPYTFDNQQQKVVDAFNELVKSQRGSTNKFTTNINQGLITRVVEDNSYYRKAIIAAEFNRSTTVGLYTDRAVHAAPISLNVITNSILKAYNPSSSVTVINNPFLEIEEKEEACEEDGKNNMSGAVVKALGWPLMAFGLMIMMTRFISLPLIERANNAKQLQLMTGLSPFIYWLSHFLWDFIIYLTSTVLVMAAIWILDTKKDFTYSGNMGILFFVLLLYGISGIPFAYLVSYLVKSTASAMSLFLMFNILTGIIAPLVTIAIKLSSGMNKLGLTFETVNVLLCLNPLYAETSALLRLVVMMVMESSCVKCSKDCPHTNPFESAPKNPYGISQFVGFLMVEWLVLWLIILLIEYGPLKKLWEMLIGTWIGPMSKYSMVEDDDVVQERQKVKSQLSYNSNKNGPSLKVCGLGKKYNRYLEAVHEVSFLVEKGECFGLLGVNGAGKTTTFKMLTGEEKPTVGSASIFNFNIVDSKLKYLREVGYCPQFDAIIDVLTGEEMLRLFAALRGIPLYKIESEVQNWVVMIGIEEFAKARCGTYSGGNKRKLSAAMAMIGDPPVVFLDEPTAGVDPVSRRKLWDMLAQCQSTGQATVLTSHSMEECEALCSRLTILVSGHMKCIGTTQYLKQKFGQGYTIMIKLFTTSNDYDQALTQFKNVVNQTFSNCFIKDEHRGLLHYHLADNSVLLSDLFSKLEHLRQSHSIVEDYTVGDTTLEQVFMSFAKQTPFINVV